MGDEVTVRHVFAHFPERKIVLSVVVMTLSVVFTSSTPMVIVDVTSMRIVSYI